MNLIPFRAIYPNKDLIASNDSFFDTVKYQYPEYVKSGFFKHDEDKSIYIYKLEDKKGEKRGILTCADIEDFNTNRILKHENTIAAKEQKMLTLTLQNQAMVKPVLVAYDRVKAISQIIDTVVTSAEPFVEIEFEATHEKHTLYKVHNKKMIKDIIQLFQDKVQKAYIADGHHRVKTCQILNETNTSNDMMDTGMKSVLTAFFGWDQLSIYGFNRVVDAFFYFSPIHFMARLSKVCKVKPLKRGRKPTQKHEMTMFLFNEWYSLHWKSKILAKYAQDDIIFDTYLLNKYILGKILDIKNVREDIRLHYIDGVSGIAGLREMVNENRNRVGFCMFPISSKDVKHIASTGGTLPPKSTWFEPRVKNGLIVKGF